MAYGLTVDGRNQVIANAITDYAPNGGVVIGTDATEGNTTITGETATVYVGQSVPSAGSGTLTTKYTAVAGGITYAEAGLKRGATLDARHALTTPVTLTNIGDMAYFITTLSAAA